jgi:hypothetical protein
MAIPITIGIAMASPIPIPIAIAIPIGIVMVCVFETRMPVDPPFFTSGLEVVDGLGDGFGGFGGGADKNFLEALGGLGDGLEATGFGALDLQCARGQVTSKGLAAIGTPNDDPLDTGKGFNALEEALALLGCGLMAAAGWHREVKRGFPH